jgi:hypothetical protein
MSIKEILELITETHNILVEDFKYTHKKEPTSKDLLLHTKLVIKEDRLDEIMDEVLLDGEIEDPEETYKLLLVAASIFVPQNLP